MEYEKPNVRRASSVDIPELCKLENECFTLPWSEKSFSDFFESPYAVAYAAEVNSTVVGYAGMYVSFGDGDITNIAVTRGFRRHGIGSALLKALSGTDSVSRLLLEVRESNLAARTLYEKYGFTIDCIRRGFYSKPTENAVLMSLNLTGRNEC